MSKELSKIKGVGPSAIEKLSEASISSIEELAKAKLADLTKIKGIGKATAEKWISQAKDLSNGSSKAEAQKTSKPKPKASQISSVKKNVTANNVSKSQKKPGSSSIKSSPSEAEFRDTAKPIPAFILDRLSKKAKKVLNLSFTTLKKMDLKDLQKSQKYLAPERIKFDPAFEDEKNALLALDEKVKFIENLIINFKDNQADRLVEENVTDPMKKGEFDEYTSRLGELLGPEECAIRIYDNLISKKAKKNYPFTETSFIRLIEKVIRKLYPDKVKQFKGK